MFFWRVYKFSFDFGGISGKRDEIKKSGQFRGPTRKDPTQQRKSIPRRGMSMPRRSREGGLDKPRVRRGVAKLRCGEGLRRSVVVLCRGLALFTDMCFCHVLLFGYSKDLSIGLMRTL